MTKIDDAKFKAKKTSVYGATVTGSMVPRILTRSKFSNKTGNVNVNFVFENKPDSPT